MGFFYTYFIAPIIWLLFKIGALFFSEFKSRDKVISEFSKTESEIPAKQNVLWVHAASMGEFEQAKPIIEYIRSKEEQLSILVTFFSPSGYDNQKNYPFADVITYIPIDTICGMEQFILKVHPDVVVFIRYEIWPNLLQLLSAKSIPYFYVNATFPNSWFWESIGRSFLKKLLSNAEGIYAVNEQNFDKFTQLIESSNVHRSADTRIDRIIEKVRTHQVERWYTLPQKPTLVLGSSWKEEEMLLHSISTQLLNEFHCIIVPHKPEIATIERLQGVFPNSVLLSQLRQEDSLDNQIVIVDSVGKLLSLYSLASVAFVGGGFGRCVHSTAEPIAYGIPTFCGPNISSSPDATTFQQAGVLTIVRNKENVETLLQKVLTEKEWIETNRKRIEEILQPSIGESERIGEIIRTYLN